MAPANKFWLTDFWGGGAAIVLPDRTVVITSPLEADRARETGMEAEVIVAKGWKEVPQALMKHLDRRDVVVDDDSGLRGKKKVKFSQGTFLEARRVKDDMEIERIRRASVGLDKIFHHLARSLRPGRSEWEVASEVMKIATEQRLTPCQDEGALSPAIIASAENGALPHSELSGRKLRLGDMVVADIFFRFEGYYSDCTRTFAIGKVSGDAKKNYEAVREAQEAALDKVREGEVCGKINDAAVDVLRRHRLDKYLNHGVGHGVGIDIHELPRVSKGEKVALKKNDVITDEPGVYFHGKYGIRIEDTLVVDRKPIVLTKFTKELVTCG